MGGASWGETDRGGMTERGAGDRKGGGSVGDGDAGDDKQLEGVGEGTVDVGEYSAY